MSRENERPIFFRHQINKSEYPADFVPSGGRMFIGVDHAKDGGDCTVKGFFKDGKFHVQSFAKNPKSKIADVNKKRRYDR